MRYRIFGSTGLRVSVIGLGTWQFGGEWGRTFSQAEADGILDRLAHNAHRIEMRGDSMRKNRGKTGLVENPKRASAANSSLPAGNSTRTPS